MSHASEAVPGSTRQIHASHGQGKPPVSEGSSRERGALRDSRG